MWAYQLTHESWTCQPILSDEIAIWSCRVFAVASDSGNSRCKSVNPWRAGTPADTRSCTRPFSSPVIFRHPGCPAIFSGASWLCWLFRFFTFQQPSPLSSQKLPKDTPEVWSLSFVSFHQHFQQSVSYTTQQDQKQKNSLVSTWTFYRQPKAKLTTRMANVFNEITASAKSLVAIDERGHWWRWGERRFGEWK